MVLLFSVMAVAVEPSFTYKIDEQFTLDLPMKNNDLSACTTCTCNVSIYSEQHGEAVIENAAGVNVAGNCKYNYTTSNISLYKVDFDFDDGFLYGSTSYFILVNYYGEITTTMMIVSDIVLLLAVLMILMFISVKHKGTDFKAKNEKIIEDHKNLGQTMAKGFVYTLFKNTFIWFYFIGWFIVLILQDLILRVNTSNVYEYFVLFANVYSLGLYLIVVFMIGLFASYMKDTIETLAENNWGLEGDGK